MTVVGVGDDRGRSDPGRPPRRSGRPRGGPGAGSAADGEADGGREADHRPERADAGFRLFPSHLTRRQRRVYRGVLVFYLAATVGLMWPVYAQFAGIRPLVLGMPLSLAYVVGWVVASFLVLLGVYAWEGRRETSARPEGSAGAPRHPRAGTGRPAPDDGPSPPGQPEGDPGREDGPPDDPSPGRGDGERRRGPGSGDGRSA